MLTAQPGAQPFEESSQSKTHAQITDRKRQEKKDSDDEIDIS